MGWLPVTRPVSAPADRGNAGNTPVWLPGHPFVFTSPRTAHRHCTRPGRLGHLQVCQSQNLWASRLAGETRSFDLRRPADPVSRPIGAPTPGAASQPDSTVAQRAVTHIETGTLHTHAIRRLQVAKGFWTYDIFLGIAALGLVLCPGAHGEPRCVSTWRIGAPPYAPCPPARRADGATAYM